MNIHTQKVILWTALVLVVLSLFGLLMYISFDSSEGNISCNDACDQLAGVMLFCNAPEVAGIVLWNECMCISDRGHREIGPVGELVTTQGKVFDVICMPDEEVRVETRKTND